MLAVLYIILILSSLISAFASISRGAIFSSGNLAGLIVIIHWIVILVLIVIATINYSAMHIIYMPIVSLVIGWILSYILQVISSMTESVEFLKYFSIFTLADIRNVITNIKINPIMPILSLVLSLVLFVLILLRYNKKELV